MTSALQLEILDLRHFSAAQLRPLLMQQAEVWETLLRWEYRNSTELLLQYLDSRILPGFVALNRGRICGYCFCVYEGRKAVIGDIYAAAGEPQRHAIAETLSRHLLELLGASPEVHRIEAQLLLFDEGALPPLFDRLKPRDAAMRVYPRLFLELELVRAQQPLPGPGSIPQPLKLCRWAPDFYQPAAGLIQEAYLGHLDSSINDQYLTLAGSERFLHNIIRFPGCGVFDPGSSFVLRDCRSGVLAAVLLCSRVGAETAHITQLCLAPGVRGQGLGRTLLHVALRHLAANGYNFLTLTVSAANTPALHLYEAAGFRRRRSFDAIVLEKPRVSRLLPFFKPGAR